MLVTAFTFAGCRSEIDDAISKLGGSKQEQEEAMGIISVSAKDPMPKLIKALKNQQLSPLTRQNVALLIGIQSEKMNEDSAVPALVAALEGAEEGVQKAVVNALAKIPGEKSLKALQDALDSKSKAVAEEAAEILDEKAAKKIAEADSLMGDQALDRQIELVKEAVEINPKNMEVKDRLAGLYTLAGKDEEARKIYSEQGEFVTAMKVLGPFPAGDQDYDTVFPETVDFTKPVAAPGGASLQWIDFTDIPLSGTVDFRKSREFRKSNSMFYAAFKVTSDKERKALLKFSSPDDYKIWLNGAVLAPGAGGGEESRTEVTLKSGDNNVLIRIVSRRYARFSVRFSTTGNKKIEGLEYKL